MPHYKVVVVDSVFPDVEFEQRLLRKVGASVSKLNDTSPTSIIKATWDADAIICSFAKITRRIISSLRKARVIAVQGVGVDNVDLTAATQFGIHVCNVPDYEHYLDIADHTVAAILALERKLFDVDRSVRDGSWRRENTSSWLRFRPIERLSRRTAGIIGLGRAGKAVAVRLKALGMRVTAYDPLLPGTIFRKTKVIRVGLNTLLRESDVVTLHCPLTAETHHMIDAGRLKLMKPTAILVNTARGGLIDQKALVKALRKRKIRATMLDVMEQEPIPRNDQILKLPNVLLSPHLAGYSERSYQILRAETALEVLRALRGEQPLHLVNLTDN